MKRMLLPLLLLGMMSAHAQYQPTWESIDKRPTPLWWKDAKFGIFIHWGVYSVPGWSTKGNYAEWYQQGLQTTDTARQRYHRSRFGDRSYYDLQKDFKAELYKPDEWARLFEKSGAKYIVLTSKHHDGYALWPSNEASKTWGFPWNAVETGPHRDLLGELFTAVRKTSVRAGMYYSLYEWFNPVWLHDKPAYVQQHMWPQMKDLINTYQPDVFWTDGDWDASAETWKSQEFLSWLFNESPVKEKIVVNDRWGSGMRFKHGGFYTPEYQPDLDFENHDWEESRGMGYSYGYNREEDAWDYNSTQSLIIALIDKVSRGGNFLLDIGPDEHGKIPPIMQERLLQMGEWLQVNGEAIYNTRRWKTPSQWSEGKRDYKMKSEHGANDWTSPPDIMLKLTVDPDPGYAVKEIFFTYNPSSNSLYAIFPKYPANRQLRLRNTSIPPGTKIQFLSTGENVTWRQQGADVLVELPEYTASLAKLPFAYAIKIEGFGKYTSRPTIQASYNKSPQTPVISIDAATGTAVYYTTDGSTPSVQSTRYEKPFQLTSSATIKAIAKGEGTLASGVTELEAQTYHFMPAMPIGQKLPGLEWDAFEGKLSSTKDLEGLKPVKQGTQSSVDLAPITRKENIGLIYQGYIKIEKDDVYTFYLASDDGSRLFIDGREIINHDGLHGNDEKTGKVALKKGYHYIRLDFIQATGGIDLKLQYSSGQQKKQEIPGSLLFHSNKRLIHSIK